MAKNPKKILEIDLNQFKFHLCLKPGFEFTLHFDSPSRRFYLSVIALVVHEMKIQNRITSIPLYEYLDELVLLNETVGESAGSSKKDHLLPRIYRKWKDSLPDLENAPLFKVVGKKKKYDELMEKIYQFSEEEKDIWANFFEYKGSHENVRLRFSIDQLSVGLEDIAIVYGENSVLSDTAAWEFFLKELEKNLEDELRTDHLDSKPTRTGIPMVKSEKRIDRMNSNKRKLIFSFLIVMVIVSTVLVIWPNRQSDPKIKSVSIEKMVIPLPEKPSIAVLPFRNLCDEPNQEYFIDGLTEEIITGLSKIPFIFVIAHDSTALYKGKQVTIQQVSENLGVQYILQGSVKKNENRIRITAKLIDSLKGRQIWAESYDKDIQDIFAIYDEITLKIIIAMNVTLSKSDHARFIKKGTNNLEAYLKVLQGIERFSRFNKVDNIVSRQRFEEAILIDPDYPVPYGFIALTHALDVWIGFTKSPAESITQGIEFVQKAISLDDDIDIPHIAMARFYLLMRQYQHAIAEANKGIYLNPNSPYAHNILGEILMFSDRPEEAIAQFKLSERLDPLARSGYLFLLGMALREVGRYDEAINYCLRSIEYQPNNKLTRLILAAAYSMTGRMEEAQVQVAEVLRIDPNFSLKNLAKVRPHIDQQNTERFIQSLRNAGLPDK